MPLVVLQEDVMTAFGSIATACVLVLPTLVDVHLELALIMGDGIRSSCQD